MPFSRKTIIIDCGASRTALGVFSQRRGRMRLERCLAENFPASAGFGPEWLVQTQIALRHLRDRFGRGAPCVLVLPGHAVLTKFIKVPRVKPEQRAKVIHFESGQNLPVALSELVWDSVIAAEQETGLEVMLAAAHLRKVEPLCAAARAAGFEPRRVLPASLAMLAAFRMVHAQPAEPSVVMNIGACSTTLLLVENGRFVVRTFAFGVTRPLAGEPIATAEITAGRLAQEFTRTLLFFRRQSGIKDPTRVYLAGGGAQLAGLAETLGARLNLPVSPLDLASGCKMSPAVGDPETPLTIAELAGAAAAELREGHAVVNLVPPLRQRQARQRRRLALAVAALALVALPLSALMVLKKPARQGARAPVRTERHAIPAIVSQEPESTVPVDAAVVQPVKDVPAGEPDFGIELLAVKAEPYRLELAGYLGGPGEYLAIFVTPGQPGTRAARSGHRFDELGIELRSFEVTTQPATDAEGSAIYEAMAVATLLDEKSGEEVVLDTRHPTLTRRHALLRLAASDRPPYLVGEGGHFSDDFASYRVNRIEVNPPAVTIARQRPGVPASEVRVLHPTPVTPPGEQPAFANGIGARPVQGVAAATR